VRLSSIEIHIVFTKPFDDHLGKVLFEVLFQSTEKEHALL
jgi:hypothetical protein